MKAKNKLLVGGEYRDRKIPVKLRIFTGSEFTKMDAR